MRSAVPSPLPYAATPSARTHVWLHRYAVVLACCTFALILVGSTVTTTGSGLAVPDWPTTYGQNMFTYPPSKWVGGIFYEHGHRLVASGVGLLTIGLCAWLWASTHPRRLKWLGTAALAAVCLQGLLGGLTVLYLLPTAISVAHAGLAEIFFCLTVIIAFATSPHRGAAVWKHDAAATHDLYRAALVVLLCVYAQILAGAVMRHTASGLAIPDFPLSYGNVLPPTSAEAIDAINLERAWAPEELPPVTLAQIWIHFAHRIGAVGIAILLAWFAHRILKRFGEDPRLAGLALGLVALLIAQFVFGALTVWTGRSLAMTTAHVGGGALMLATALGVVLVAREGRLQCEAATDNLTVRAASAVAPLPEGLAVTTGRLES